MSHSRTLLTVVLLLASSVPTPAQDAKLAHRTYAVADLVVPVDMDATAPAKNAATREADLIRVLTKHVAPASWEDNGGPGKVSYYPLSMSLVVTQTAAVHAEVERLLTKLRREQDREIAIEMRLVWVEDGTLAALAAKLEPGAAQPENLDAAIAAAPARLKARALLLNDAQVRDIFEFLQGDRRTNIMQAPKVTMFNGQKAALHVGDEHFFLTGVEVKDSEPSVIQPKQTKVFVGQRHVLRPTLDGDGKTIRLGVQLEVTELHGPTPLTPIQVPVKADDGKSRALQMFLQQPTVTRLTLENTFKIPDQQTQLVYVGATMKEARSEVVNPVLARVPYVNRLFRNVGYSRETGHLVLLLTPRVVVNDEVTVQRP